MRASLTGPEGVENGGKKSKTPSIPVALLQVLVRNGVL